MLFVCMEVSVPCVYTQIHPDANNPGHELNSLKTKTIIECLHNPVMPQSFAHLHMGII